MKPLLLSLALSLGTITPVLADSVYTIYPVPQRQVAVAGTVGFTPTVTLVCEAGIDAPTVARAKGILQEAGFTVVEAAEPSATTANVLLGINGSGLTADAKVAALGLQRDVFTKASKYDRHILSLTDGGAGHALCIVLGENTDATFVGLASLEYMLESKKENMPCVTIYDYADQQNRGIVEGYYGVPYSAEVKKDMFRFMMRHKMNSYMYGAKSDYYHSAHWQDPYPTTITEEQRKIGYLSQDMVSDICQAAHDTKVNFIWAIHPGNAFLNSSTVVSDIMKKYESMYALGVRQFAIFVDDVSIPSTADQYALNAQRVTDVQRAMEAKWNVAGAAAADTVKPLQFVPQIYCSAFAGGGETQRRDFFTALAATPQNVAIYTTGWGVWSVPNTSDVNQVKQYLGRDVAWWWNYPCNDNDHNKLFPMDMYSNFSDETQINNNARIDPTLTACLGVLSNPMQQGEVAKIPLFSVADYAWNNDGYDNIASWNAAFPRIVEKDMADDYKFLASYLRYYDAASLDALINSYKQTFEAGTPDGAALKQRMDSIATAAAHLCMLEQSERESDRLLYNDLKPWLLKLRSMAEQTSAYINLAASAEDKTDEKWTAYTDELALTNALTTADDFHAPALAGSVGATLTLQKRLAEPAARALTPFVDYMKSNALNGYFPERDILEKPVGISSIEGVSPRAYYTEKTGKAYVTLSKAATLQKGDYVGIKLAKPAHVRLVEAADTLLQNHHVVMSTDGKQWTRVTEKSSTPEAPVRYLCVVNDSDTPESIKLSSTSLRFTLPELTSITAATIPTGNLWQNHGASYLTDGDYSTFVCLNRNQQQDDTYTVELGKATEIGDVRICMGTTNGDYPTTARVQVSEDGATWTDLTVKGTEIKDFKMSLKQVVKYNDEMSYCDFDGLNQTARYVRLVATTPNTAKWLRLYEIEVNRATDAAKFLQLTEDADGQPATAAADNNAATVLSTPAGQSVTYHFLELTHLTGVKIYADPATQTTLTAEVTDDNANWTSLGTIPAAAVTKLDLTAHPAATALRLSWAEGDAVPAIHEICEETDPTSKPIVTRIENLTAPSAAAPTLRVANGQLQIAAAEGLQSVKLYTPDGRTILEARLAASSATLAIPRHQGIVLATVRTASEQQYTFKLIVK